MTAILHPRFPEDLWQIALPERLPGVHPGPQDGLRCDEMYGAQMALRDRLIEERHDAVIAALPGTGPALAELFAMGLAACADLPGYSVQADHVVRPDGARVALDPGAPLETLGRLFQQDLCLLHPGPEGHLLTAAVLCFPASWALGDKIGRPLVPIHAPVAAYTPDIAARVQRLFDAIRPGAPLMRANLLLYEDPALFQPRRESDPRPRSRTPGFVRSERQILTRLPRSGAVVFSIHTVVVALADLSEAQRADLRRAGRI